MLLFIETCLGVSYVVPTPQVPKRLIFLNLLEFSTLNRQNAAGNEMVPGTFCQRLDKMTLSCYHASRLTI